MCIAMCAPVLVFVVDTYIAIMHIYIIQCICLKRLSILSLCDHSVQ